MKHVFSNVKRIVNFVKVLIQIVIRLAKKLGLLNLGILDYITGLIASL